MFGLLLTKWTVRLSLACYVAYLAGWLTVRSPQWPRAARVIWTLGCVLFDVHVACAFHFYHQWSHTVAWRHTAAKTEELLGVAVGNGIYFSYLFLVLWLLDVAWLWLAPLFVQDANRTLGSHSSLTRVGATPVPQRAAGWFWTPSWRVVVHVFLLFIALNGAIVFESGPTRWAGIVAVVVLGYLAIRRAYSCVPSQITNCRADVAA